MAADDYYGDQGYDPNDPNNQIKPVPGAQDRVVNNTSPAQNSTRPLASPEELKKLGWSDADIAGYNTQFGPGAPTRTGNPQTDWQSFINARGYTGAQARTMMPQYIDEFNKGWGYNAKAGNPNAAGTIDTADFGSGVWTDLIHGGDNSWQWLNETGGGQPGQPTGGGNNNYVPRAPFAPGARQATPTSMFSDPSAMGDRNKYMDLLAGIATGSRPESANPNFNIDPNDPIIKGQVDAYSGQNQLAQRRYLSQIAERQGSNANISAETRAAAESGGQATSAFQAKLMGDELASRKSEVQQALTQYGSFLSNEQRMRLEEKLSQIQLAEQQYQFDSGMGEKAYEFDTNQQYLNSPLGPSAY